MEFTEPPLVDMEYMDVLLLALADVSRQMPRIME